MPVDFLLLILGVAGPMGFPVLAVDKLTTAPPWQRTAFLSSSNPHRSIGLRLPILLMIDRVWQKG